MSLRTGHCDPSSLQSYQHLKGGLGVRQQHDILSRNDDEERKSKIPEILTEADTSSSSNAIEEPSISGVISTGSNEGEAGQGAPAVVSSILLQVGSVSNNKINITINCNTPKQRCTPSQILIKFKGYYFPMIEGPR